jgi:hypothetical protein
MVFTLGVVYGISQSLLLFPQLRLYLLNCRLGFLISATAYGRINLCHDAIRGPFCPIPLCCG